MKTIYMVGEINDEMFKKVYKQIKSLEAANNKKAKILLSSEGGLASSALAIVDLMALSPIEFTVVATGLVASAAIIILAVGDQRIMTPSAWVMVHEEQTEDVKSQNVSEMERKTKSLRRLENQWNRILAHNTIATFEQWEELNRTDTYLSPIECAELGLIDDIAE